MSETSSWTSTRGTATSGSAARPSRSCCRVSPTAGPSSRAVPRVARSGCRNAVGRAAHLLSLAAARRSGSGRAARTSAPCPRASSGSPRRSTQMRGALYAASSSRTWASRSFCAGGRPGAQRTNAHTCSPHFSSGMPTTATSPTAGWVNSRCSISRGKMFSPPRMIMSFRRPSIRQWPRSSIEARSPVWSQPSASIARGRRVGHLVVAVHHEVAAGAQLAHHPAGSVSPLAGSTIRTSVCGSGPADRGRTVARSCRRDGPG